MSKPTEISVEVVITYSQRQTDAERAKHGESVISSLKELLQKVEAGSRSFVVIEPDIPAANGYGENFIKAIKEQTEFIVNGSESDAVTT